MICRGDLGVRVVELRREVDAELAGVFDDAGPMLLPRPLSPLLSASSSRCQAGTGSAVMVAQVSGSRGSSRVKRSSKVRAEASRWVRGVAEVPDLAQGGDQRGVAVLVVEHGALLDPGGDEDRRDAVAGSVEREAELAGRRGRVGRGHGPRGHVVVGAARLVPADQQSGVPDVRARLRDAGAVGLEDALQEGLAGADRGRRVERVGVGPCASERPKAGW